MTAIRALLIIAFCVALAPYAAAQTTLVAQADFNSDVLWETPDGSLPGGPEGDYLWWNANMTPYVVKAAGTLADQPIEIERPSGPGGALFQLRLPNDATACSKFVLRWRVARTSSNNYFSMLLVGTWYHGLLTFHAETISIGTSLSLTDLIAVTTVPEDVDVLLEWEIDRTTGLQSLSIDGMLVVEDLATSFTFPDHTAAMFSFEMGGQSAQSFALDDIEVYTVDCATPVEPTSWGSIKGSYR